MRETKDGDMQNLFNYSTLDTKLEKSTRTLFVTLNQPQWQNAFRMEMLFELESLFAWCTSRIEISSIFINSSTHYFSKGIEKESLPQLTGAQLEKMTIKLQKIIFSMMQLPQTIIMDLGDGTENLASEFALGADIRIASNKTQISFNHCLYGMVPASGGMSLLSVLAGPAMAKSWLLSGSPIKNNSLLSTGLVTDLYEAHERQPLINQILEQVHKAAPVQRIQAKLGLFESLRPQIEAGIVNDRKIAKASLVTEDWKKRKPEDTNLSFMPAKSMAYAVKLSLVKSEDRRSELDH